MDLFNCYDQEQNLYYMGNVTNPSLQTLADSMEQPPIYTVLKSMCLKNNVEYYSERININHANGIFNSSNQDLINDRNKLYGFEIDAEDPRLFVYHDDIYMLFNIRKGQQRVMCLSRYDQFQPIELHVEGMPPNQFEKNWSPLVKEDQVYLIYSYDPLVVLHYDFNSQGTCYVVYRQENVSLPVSTTYLRGGSNLLPYKGDYYLGLCHSRISTSKINIGGYEFCYYLAFAIMLDTKLWQVVYLSKPLMFSIDEPIVKRIGDLIFDETPWMCTTTPTSLNLIGSNTYLLTVNINETITLKYQWQPEMTDPMDSTDSTSRQIGDWNTLAKERSIALIRCASPDVNVPK